MLLCPYEMFIKTFYCFSPLKHKMNLKYDHGESSLKIHFSDKLLYTIITLYTRQNRFCRYGFFILGREPSADKEINNNFCFQHELKLKLKEIIE